MNLDDNWRYRKLDSMEEIQIARDTFIVNLCAGACSGEIASWNSEVILKTFKLLLLLGSCTI
jgi:hypothetical protein